MAVGMEAGAVITRAAAQVAVVPAVVVRVLADLRRLQSLTLRW